MHYDKSNDSRRSAKLTKTLNMTYINFILLTELSIRGILYPVMLCQLTR